MKRIPIDDFIFIKHRIEEIGQQSDFEELFKELSESLALVENDILTDNIGVSFKEDLGCLIIAYLSFISVRYNIDDFYDYLVSRRHFGIFDDAHFENKRKSLVEPYYKLRMETSNIILNKKRGMSAKPLFDLAAYLIYLEED